MVINAEREAELLSLECPGATAVGPQVDLRAFARLHPDGRALIKGWLGRAVDAVP